VRTPAKYARSPRMGQPSDPLDWIADSAHDEWCMSANTAEALIHQARGAASQGDWDQAYDLLIQAEARESLAGEALALLADVAYAAGHLDVTIEVWERAHAGAVKAGDHVEAAQAAVRVAFHLLADTALLAPVRGWVKRAERLLEGRGDTPVHAWLAVVRAYERLLSGDFEAARQWAHRAIGVGTDQSEPGAAAIGRVAQARALILEGDVHDGLSLLDEAAVATVSGELDPLSAGFVYCEVVCAWQGLAQFDRAEEWTEAMERWRHKEGIGSLNGRCRVHRAEILRLRGACREAEHEAVLACEELRPYLRREFGWPLTELGRIRLRREDLEGAEEAFTGAHEAGWDPQPGLALLRLAQGDVSAAAASIRDALEHPLDVPSKELPPNTELRRAPLLEAQVEIAVAAGDLERARWAADELSRIADSFESRALGANAALARGRVLLAEGQAASARPEFEEALRIWNEISAPFETALARMGLAQATRAEGEEERALLEFRAAQSTFERVGAVRQADRAAQACGDIARDDFDAPKETHAPPAGGMRLGEGESAPAPSVFSREGDYWSIVFEGHTIRMRDLKGLRYLSRLLADPGREFHVMDLVVGERDAPASGSVSPELGLRSSIPGDAGELLDARAKDAYRRRLAEIDEDIAESRAIGDAERAARADAERDFLVGELSRAVGLGGRNRRAQSASERARASVTQAVRHAMARLREHNPDLGKHLDSTIRTGTYCVYLPDPRVPATWKV
jgi:tetratricopeptide (TPR) repeat protein